jgi:hypothetical protein
MYRLSTTDCQPTSALNRPIAAFSQYPSELLQECLIEFIKAFELCTIYIDDADQAITPAFHCLTGRRAVLRTYGRQYWHHNLAVAVVVAGNVTWERVDVENKLGLQGGGGGAAHPSPYLDGLACYFALKWSENEGLVRSGWEVVEA